MEKSLKVLIAGSACFIAGFVIFTVALFAHIEPVEVYAAIGFILVIVFLILTYVSMYMRSKEKSSEEEKEKK